jgi:predicted nucleic acid-binding protein
MKPRIFLDSNVFVYAFEFTDSNSRLIIDLLNKGEIEAIVSGRVLKEVSGYFRRFHGSKLSSLFRNFILQSCTMVLTEELKMTMKRLEGSIKEKDLEQLAAVKALGLRQLVSFDRHFEPFEEYATPRQFVESLGMTPRKSEF